MRCGLRRTQGHSNHRHQSGTWRQRIDVLPWSDEPAHFVKLALAPARVLSVELDSARHRAVAHVPSDQFSLARGADAINQQLASELTGWSIELVVADAV